MLILCREDMKIGQLTIQFKKRFSDYFNVAQKFNLQLKNNIVFVVLYIFSYLPKLLMNAFAEDYSNSYLHTTNLISVCEITTYYPRICHSIIFPRLDVIFTERVSESVGPRIKRKYQVESKLQKKQKSCCVYYFVFRICLISFFHTLHKYVKLCNHSFFFRFFSTH